MLGLTHITPGVRSLLWLTLIVSVSAWVVGAALPMGVDGVFSYLAFSGDAFLHGYVWQVLTFPWVYWPASGPLVSFIFHALMLWMFGSSVEGEIGTRRFYQLVASSILAGAAAATVSTLAGFPVAMAGLILPLFAVSMTFCFLNKEEVINFMLFLIVLPIRGKYLGIVLLALDFAYYPRLIPCFLAALGAAYVVVVKRWWPDLAWARKPKARSSRLSGLPTGGATVSPLRPLDSSRSAAAESEVDRILDKLRSDGMAALTPQEKETLDRHSRSLRLRDEGSR